MESTGKADGGPPTSTTKALLLFIHVPKVHRIYIKQDDEDGNEDDSGTRDTASQSVGSRKASLASLRNEKLLPEESSRDDVVDKKVTLSATTTEHDDDDDSAERDIGYVEADDEVEHVITAEEMATVVKLDEKLDEKKGDEDEETESKTTLEDSVAEKQEEAPTLKQAVMNVFFGVITNKEDEIKTKLDREEAIRAIKDQKSQLNDPLETETSPDQHQGPIPNTEIKLQALLGLTCKNLYKEGCFYTAPTVTNIAKGEEQNEWIQFTIMVKPGSIGLVLEALERIGVGSSVGMISIYKTELLRTADWPKLDQKKKDEDNKSIRVSGKKKKEQGGVNLEAARAEWKNAASRLRVEQVQEQIKEQAAMSFDFLALLIIASILAGIGLIVDSTVVIVASMLVSPIMGPVMGITFGTRVLDWKLARSSALVEVGALSIAIFIGAIIGFASSWSLGENWPNDEMSSRGDITGLITGIAIAVPSGMGVALSILGNNTASLVGVAISASLLPPAVNAGICWAHAILIQSGVTENSEDFVSLGAISFALTVVNIVCIWVSGILMFAVKEVAPSQSISAFWSRDIKTARAIKKQGAKDPEVDLDALKAGLQDALERRKAEEANSAEGPRAKFRRRLRRRRKQINFSFNLDGDPIDDDDYLYYMLGLSPIDEATTSGDERRDIMARHLGFRTSLQDFDVEEDLVAADSMVGWKSLFY